MADISLLILQGAASISPFEQAALDRPVDRLTESVSMPPNRKRLPQSIEGDWNRREPQPESMTR
ncbi:MAG: hypothetical protein ACK4SZ_13730 [Allosphingosinicella sp.]|uniref:hypothetical protein n=1 Tax=Allosphingosinicella sp. TaxID=2823234 RepID=UPI003950EF10